MKVLLDSNAYSLLMRGHGEVAGLVRRAEERPPSIRQRPLGYRLW